MIPPLIIRASGLPQYADCARRTATRLIPDQIREWGYSLNETPHHVGGLVGTATHAGVAHVLERKRESGTAYVDSETKDRAEAAFKQEAEHGVAWDDVTPKEDVALRQVNRMVGVYTDTIAQAVNVLAVEQKLELQTRAGHTLQGRVDLTTEAVRDLKTGKFQSGNVAQYGAYSLLIRGNGGQVEYVVEDYLKRVAWKEPQPAPVSSRYETPVAEAAAAAIVRRIEQDYATFMEAGDPVSFLANPNSVLCGARFCPAFGTDFCREHRR